MRGEQGRHHVPAGRLPRRVTDVVEDVVVWLLLSASLLVVALAVITGAAGHGRVENRIREEAQERTRVPATVLSQAPLVPFDPGSPNLIVVEAQWVGPDGTRRTGPVPVGAATQAGAEVTVWLDRDGAVVEPPATGMDAVAAGVFTGIAVLFVGGSVLGVVWVLVRRVVDAVNSRRWAREWADVGPEWSGRR